MTVAIIDYGSGNLHSAAKAFERAARGMEQPDSILVTRDPERVWRADRVVLPGVLTTDRLRVWRAYATALGWSRTAARRRLPWLVAKTIARRRAERGVAIPARADFRTVMRADGPYAVRARQARP